MQKPVDLQRVRNHGEANAARHVASILCVACDMVPRCMQ
jgi:hypothetical protein